ncbi:MAG: hypothetical protein U5J98_00060 [Halobacteriales archaeon]|nr:hypothetical protein [Halobacteriales archaeon]
MRGALVLALTVRYTLAFGGGLALVALAVGTGTGLPTWALGLGLLVLGVLIVTTTLTGANGVGLAGMAIEPASGVNIDPIEYLQAPVGSNQFKALFFGAGLVVFGGAMFVVFG